MSIIENQVVPNIVKEKIDTNISDKSKTGIL